jgi:hypothetical protein
MASNVLIDQPAKAAKSRSHWLFVLMPLYWRRIVLSAAFFSGEVAFFLFMSYPLIRCVRFDESVNSVDVKQSYLSAGFEWLRKTFSGLAPLPQRRAGDLEVCASSFSACILRFFFGIPNRYD